MGDADCKASKRETTECTSREVLDPTKACPLRSEQPKRCLNSKPFIGLANALAVCSANLESLRGNYGYGAGGSYLQSLSQTCIPICCQDPQYQVSSIEKEADIVFQYNLPYLRLLHRAIRSPRRGPRLPLDTYPNCRKNIIDRISPAPIRTPRLRKLWVSFAIVELRVLGSVYCI